MSQGKQKLWDWFGLSYASFLVLPRILMHDMPDEWQSKMADLLDEYDETYPNQPDMGTRVQATKDGKLVKWPEWLLRYRRADKQEIERLKRRHSVKKHKD